MENNLLEKIENEYKALSKTHRVIADLFIDDLVTADTTLMELAKLGYCSHSTVLRFIRILGYKNFKVFMDDFFNSKTKDTISLSYKIVDTYLEKNAQELNQLVDAMINAKHVYILGHGMSYLPAYNLGYKCNMIINKFLIYTELPQDCIIGDDDLVIYVSNSGNSRKLRMYYKRIPNYYLITNFQDSNLAKKARQVYSPENHLESSFILDTQPRESIYSLVYLTDCIFSLLQSKSLH